MTVVSFPGLGIESLRIDPVAFTLFDRPVYWYGLIIAVALLAGVCVALVRAKRQHLSADNVYDLALFATPIAVICARLYYVIFNFEQYRDNPIKMLYIWEGGIAIYGAVIGAVATAYLYARIKKINVGNLFDMGCIALILGQSIGRWGNFINGEAYGVATELPWRMAVNGVLAHPTFLYESLWTLAGFFLLWNYEKRKRFHGEVFLMYVLWYGIGRAWIEGLRTDSLMLGTVRVSQLLAILSAAAAVVMILIKRKKYKNVPLAYPELEEEKTNEKSDH